MRSDVAVALFLIGSAGFLYQKTEGFPGGAEIFPRLLLLTIVLLAAIQLIVSLRRIAMGAESSRSGGSAGLRPYVTFALVTLCVVGLQTIGFFASTGVFLVVTMAYLGERRALSYAVAVSAIRLFYYLLFVRFLHVPLPGGLVF